jgi:hypothetical protein
VTELAVVEVNPKFKLGQIVEFDRGMGGGSRFGKITGAKAVVAWEANGLAKINVEYWISGGWVQEAGISRVVAND